MADWGVTEKGFRRKTYPEIISDMEAKAKDLFGADIDLSSASPLALFLRVIAFGLSLIWMVAERVYYSGYVDTATGQSLDYVVKYAGISRRPATPARRMLRFAGDPGVVIPRGFLVEAEMTGARFATVEDAVIEADGTVEVMAQAVEPGLSGNIPPDQINVITNPIPGVSSVVGVESERNSDGLNRETDRELRERYYASLATGGASTLDSIRASVLAVPGVRTARVFHNPTMQTVDGRPPKSVEVVALGGDDRDIAEAIHDSIAAGIEPYGDIEVEVIDAGGETQLIRFSRAEVVDIYVNVYVTATSSYPLDGDEQVRDEIIRYIGGIDSTGELRPGTGLGEPVIWTALIEAARRVPGVQDVDIRVGTDPDPTGQGNVVIGPRQVAETSIDKITITRS